jgi:hypothetical protein
MNWYYHNKVGINMKYFWTKILEFKSSLLPPLIIGILMNLYVDLYDIMSFFICGIVYVIIFALSFWCLGMNQYEKELISVPITRLIKKYRSKIM